MQKLVEPTRRQHPQKPEPVHSPLTLNPDTEKNLHTAFGRPRAFLNNRFVYAVISQRAGGLSIGVNMNPDKRCNFNCPYCEVNRDAAPLDQTVDLRIMTAELENLLTLSHEKKLHELPWFRNLPDELLQLKEVALSGDGEPTLCPNFTEVVREVIYVRSKGKFPFFKIVLITNSTGLHLSEVKHGLQLLNSRDEIWAKLDAGTQEFMNKVNGGEATLKKVLANLLLTGREHSIVIQSLFPLINGEEPPWEEIEEYVQRLSELKSDGAQISMVQVYSAHRPPHRSDCGHLPLKTLSQIARRVREVTGLKAEVF